MPLLEFDRSVLVGNNSKGPNMTPKADFEFFLIQELTGPKEEVYLRGNQMPHQPFSWGGKQRIKKDYYPGNSEPVTHVLGPEEGDVTINGRFYDKTLPVQINRLGKGAAYELAQQIQEIRKRGNFCRFLMGEWKRYGHISETDFQMKHLSDLLYTITLSITGFNLSKNCQDLEQSNEIPFEINKELINEVSKLQKNFSVVPRTIPRSLADLINDSINTVATQVKVVTDFVDNILTTAEDLQDSVNRAIGFIRYAQQQVHFTRRRLGRIGILDAISPNQPITRQYQDSEYFMDLNQNVLNIALLLQKIREDFVNSIEATPETRHLVVEGDTLQKISNRYYGNPGNWTEIYFHNNLKSTTLEPGTNLEIPEL